MTNAQFTNAYGRATIDPDGDVVAGSYGTWRLTYEAGSRGMSVGGRIRVWTDTDTDWGLPQLLDPAGPDYMTVEAPDGVRVNVRVDGPRSLQITLHGRALKPNEQVTLIYGDTRGGGLGSRAQTFIEDRRYFRVDVDADGTGHREPLADPPHVRIVGDRAIRLVAIAPSSVSVNEPFSVLLKAEDRWGNPSESYRGTVEFSGDGLEAEYPTIAFTDQDTGAKRVEGFRAVCGGVLTLTVHDSRSELQAISNPIVVDEEPAEHRLCWADPHGGQVVHNGKFADFFRYARDVAGVQFVGFQRNADCISPEDWEVQQQQERAFYDPGRFVPIPGFEWSGRTPEGGHHNVYFRRHNQPVRRNPPAEVAHSVDQATELPHIRDVYETYRNADVTITPHVGGEHSNLTWHEPALEPAVEIVSSHGCFEWMLREALEKGYRLGFLGGSDSYTGRPGDDRPGYQLRRYSKAGLTGIYVKEITLEAFHEAMKARRVYATTGTRLVLRTEADGHFMGAEYTTSSPPTLHVDVVGTAPLESVELFRGLDRIHALPIETKLVPRRVRILWSGSSRMTSYSGVIWDGALFVRSAEITGVQTLRFDSPRSHVVDCTRDSLRWHAWGCGYPMGLLVDLDGGGDAELHISVQTQTMTGAMYGGHGSEGPRRISFAPAERAAMCVRLSDLRAGAGAGALSSNLGVLDRNLSVSLDREPGPLTAEFAFTDPSPQPGVNPYWVRVVQSDLEMGWTSPIFVDYAPLATGR